MKMQKMQRIKNYEVGVNAPHISLPKGAEVLGVISQNNCPCILALAGDGREMTKRDLLIVEAGDNVPRTYEGKRYLGTVKIRPSKHPYGNDNRTYKVTFHVFIEATPTMRHL